MRSQSGFLLFEVGVAYIMLMLVSCALMSSYVQLIAQHQQLDYRMRAVQELISEFDRMRTGAIACESHEVQRGGHALMIIVERSMPGYAQVQGSDEQAQVTLRTGMLV